MPDPASIGDVPTVGYSPPPALLRPTVTRVGDYELLGELARGGMGVVYRARQVSANRVVALKMILAGEFASPAERQRFRAEAEAAAGLDHPHILPVYEVGESNGRPFFSMKLADGGSLADKVPELVADPTAAAALVAKLARAVHFAHQRAVLHRDLKPANVLLGEDGEPLVTDFGLAKRTDSDSGQTRTGAVVGTPSYMPPEQARGDKQITTAADVYALGAVLYELLCGRPPFREPTVLGTVKAVLEHEPPPPPKTADRDLSAVALKCLVKEPAGRYASAADLADDLDRWGRGEPTRARPLSVAGQAWRWLRRNTAAAVALPALGLAWGASVGLTLFAVHALSAAPNAGPILTRDGLPWYSAVWWLHQLQGRQALCVGVVTTAALLSALVGPLVRLIGRPSGIRPALGLSAFVAVVAAQTAGLYVGPVAVSDLMRNRHRAGVFPLPPEREVVLYALTPGGGASTVVREFESLRPFLPSDRRDLPLPTLGRGRPAEDSLSLSELLELREAARASNLTHAMSVTMAGTNFLGLAFFLGVAAASSWGAEAARRARGWHAAGQVYGAVWAGGVLVTASVLLGAFLSLIGSPADTTGLFAATGVAAVMSGLAVAGGLRAASRDWRWWVNDLSALAWLAAVSGLAFLAVRLRVI